MHRVFCDDPERDPLDVPWHGITLERGEPSLGKIGQERRIPRGRGRR